MNLILCLHLSLMRLLMTDPSETTDTSAQYSVRHFTDEDGLPQNSVKGIVPDENGFLWLATENGLTRFDGSYFLNFNGDNFPGLRSSRIWRLYPGDSAVSAETDVGEILTITRSSIAHIGWQLPEYRYLRYVEKKTNYYPVRGWPDDYAIVLSKVRPVVLPHDKESYFEVERDTITFNNKGKAEYRIVERQLDLSRLFVSGGRLLYIGNDGSMSSWEKNKRVEVALKGDIPKSSVFRGGKMKLFWNTAAHQVFIYSDRTCYELRFENDGAVHCTEVLRYFDLDKAYISTVYLDRTNQRVFLGSSTKGLYVCTRKQFHVYKSAISGEEVFYAQAPFHGKGVVTASGIAFDSAGNYSWLPQTFNPENTLEKYTLAQDSKGRYWGRQANTLVCIAPDFGRVLQKFELPDLIEQVYADRKGNIWVGGRFTGLYFIRASEAKLAPQHLAAPVKDLTFFVEGTDDVFWVGTRQGLYRVHLPSLQTDTIPGLRSAVIRSLYAPGNDEVWIGTYNRGIYLFRNGRLRVLPQDRQRYMATTHCIIEDNEGYLWLTTNKGLFSIRRQDALDYADGKLRELFYYYFGKDQGFHTNEFNGGCQPCAFKYENGDISVPSLDGLVHFSPASLRLEIPDKDIFVDWVEHNLKLTVAGGRFDLPHNFQSFRLHVSSPYFGDPRNLHFYYSLEWDGQDEEQIWLPVNSDRTITLTSLPSGDYRVRIRKLKGFGAQQYIEKVFVISVQQAFYEKWWFRVSVAMGLIGLIILLYKIRVRHIRETNRQLELKVASRTRELEDTMAILQESDEQLRRQSFMHKRLLTAITHDIKTPLKFLLKVNNRQPGNSVLKEEEVKTVTYDSLYRMHHLVDNLIHYMRTSFRQGEFSAEPVDLFLLMEEKAEIFRPVSDSTGIEIINRIPSGTMIVVNRLLLAVVLHNLLDNAVKYTTKGYVEITVEQRDGMLVIFLSDTGCGMPLPVLDWVNQEDNSETSVLSKAGIGLLLVKELLTMIGGKLSARPGVDGGTIVSLQLRQWGE
jgi:signal transduction histidine kinase